MEIVDLWKFGHIAAMFAAVSIFVGQGMLEAAVARSGDVRALRRVLAASERFAPIGGGLFLLGIVLGVITALVGGWDLTQPWLIIGYVLSANHPRDRLHVPHPDRQQAEGPRRGKP
jgi:hypothetical protein